MAKEYCAVTQLIGVIIAILFSAGWASAQCDSLTFSGPINTAASNIGSDIIPGDFNGDGNIDIISTSSDFSGADNTITLHLGQGDGTFGSATIIQGAGNGNPFSGSPFSGIAVDINSDGRLDFIVRNFRPQNFQIFLNQGNGSFNSSTSIAAPIDEATITGFPYTADFNNDGRLDILGYAGPRVSRLGGTITTHLQQSDGTFTNTEFSEAVPGTFTASGSIINALTDMTGDGIVDLAITSRIVRQEIDEIRFRIVPGNGDGTLNFPGETFFTVNNLNTRLNDVNRDGRLDLIAIEATQTDGTQSVTVRANLGNGSFGAPTTAFIGAANDRLSFGPIADFNNDGTADISVSVLPSGTSQPTRLDIYLNNGSGTFNNTPITINTESNIAIVKAADFNNDSRADLLFKGSPGTNPVAIYLANCQTAPCARIKLTPETMTDSKMGKSISHTMTARGGRAPYTFSFTGNMPTGVTMNADGLMSGTMTAPGSFTFTVTATDANGCSGSQTYTILVHCGTMQIEPAAMQTAYLNRSFSINMTTSAGAASFVLTSGNLPPGISLSAEGMLAGTPTSLGHFTFNITATTTDGCSVSRTMTIRVLNESR